MAKKNSNRISLAFSPYSTEQREAVALLKTLGRKKSSFISKAIKYYLDNCPDPEIPGVNMEATQALTETRIRKIIQEMLQGGELPAATVKTKPTAPQKPKEEPIIEKPAEEKPKQEKSIDSIPEAPLKKEQGESINNIDSEESSVIEEASDLLDMLTAFDD